MPFIDTKLTQKLTDPQKDLIKSRFGEALKILNKTDMDDYESLQYFQRVLESSGILAALVERGVKEGDNVHIYDLEFEYVP